MQRGFRSPHTPVMRFGTFRLRCPLPDFLRPCVLHTPSIQVYAGEQR
jgi:hypothetical protein